MHLPMFHPMLASGALQFAFHKATTEGKITIGVFIVVSFFSWTVIITKTRQLWIARRNTRKFLDDFRAARDPLELLRKEIEYEGAPVNDVYYAGVEEFSYHLKNNPVNVKGKQKISAASFDFVRVALERAVSTAGLDLEKGMIVLSTAVAG